MLRKIQEELSRRRLCALVVPSADPHNSEYVAECFKRRERVCGFAGSSGTCVITPDDARLWTDGRYWIEAAQSLQPGWSLMRDRPADSDNYTVKQFLKEVSSRAEADSKSIGVDAMTVTAAWWSQMKAEALPLVDTPVNLVDVCSQPAVLPTAPVFKHDDAFAGKATREKLADLAASLLKEGLDLFVISALDDVAWLFNLRGSDVPFCPVFYAFAAVTASGAATLFVEPAKIGDEVAAYLASINVVVRPYGDIFGWLASFPASQATAGSSSSVVVRCGYDPNQLPQRIKAALEASGIECRSTRAFVQWAKSIKNETELTGFRSCHVRDGAALTRFLAWLDARILAGETISETEAADELERVRSRVLHYRGLSFETIAGSGPNGAIIHYRPSAERPTVIRRDSLFLLDSGAQYSDGTTDVTRTVCFDPPTSDQRTAYTLVLKGHIALNQAVFPTGIAGHRLDCLARQYLWKHGKDYQHGTGHGVGSFLNVHEGPHGIGTVPLSNGAGLRCGMIVSNEPGFYAEGQYGIRIENLDEVLESAAGGATGGYLGLRSLTLAPLCRDLIEASLLDDRERAWVNEYHRRVEESLSPLIQEDEVALRFLKRHTSTI